MQTLMLNLFESTLCELYGAAKWYGPLRKRYAINSFRSFINNHIEYAQTQTHTYIPYNDITFLWPLLDALKRINYKKEIELCFKSKRELGVCRF